MPNALYDDAADFYHLIDPVEEHAEEAALYHHALQARLGAAAATPTLLELGAGAGNNAFHMKRRWRCTLTDIAPRMLARSRAQNPDCEHLEGDMRALRLGRTFDAVLVHDAVVYMTDRAALRAALETAFVHLRPGGAAVFAPDCILETFRERSDDLEGDDGARAMRGIEWSWDPVAGDEKNVVEYGLLLRDADGVRMVHDHQVEGLFARATWIELLRGVGFDVDTAPRVVEDGAGFLDEVFVCRRR
jgi:SAM-dependent methyltransferase